MTRLVLIDFMYLIHKHLYYVKQKEKELRARNGGVYTPLMSSPNTGEETARLYFVLRDLEKILNKYEGDEETHIVVCTDRKSARKTDEDNNATTYKANRSPNRFDTHDIVAIAQAEKAIAQLGIPVLGYKGYEADDIIQSIVAKYEGLLSEIIVYTPDADLAVLVDDKVKLMRYKGVYSKMSYIAELPEVPLINSHALVTIDNFEKYFSTEYSKKGPVTIDYNTLAFYKSTVGDPADNIKGITRFGNSAYMELRLALIKAGQWPILKSIKTAEEMTSFFDNMLSLHITEAQLAEVKAAYDMVRPRYIDIESTELRSSVRLPRESRKNVYLTAWGINKIC